MTRLEHLTLSNRDIRNDLFMALSSMTALKSLHMQYFKILDSVGSDALLRDPQLQKVNIQNLMDLQVSTNSIQLLICVLNQLTPSPKRALKCIVKPFNTSSVVPLAYLNSGIHDNLTNMLYGSDSLTLALGRNKISINVDLEYPADPRGPHFLFDLDLGGHAKTEFASAILNNLLSCDLSSIRFIRLYFPTLDINSPSPEYEFMYRYLYKLFTESLGNVEMVILGYQAFHVLSLLQDIKTDVMSIFPSLQTILFEDGQHVRTMTYVIKQFIDSRTNRTAIRVGKLGIPATISGQWNITLLDGFEGTVLDGKESEL